MSINVSLDSAPEMRLFIALDLSKKGMSPLWYLHREQWAARAASGCQVCRGHLCSWKQQGYCRAIDLSCWSTLHGQVYSMARSHKAFLLTSHKNNLDSSVSFRCSIPLQRELNWVKKQQIPTKSCLHFCVFLIYFFK